MNIVCADHGLAEEKHGYEKQQKCLDYLASLNGESGGYVEIRNTPDEFIINAVINTSAQ